MRNFAWRDLPNVDRTVTHFASRVNFFYEDMDAMMVRSRQLQDELAAGAAWNQKPSGLPGLGTEGSWADLGFEDGKLDDALVARIVACEWVQNNTMKWSTWIPALCEPGTIPNPEMTSCLAQSSSQSNGNTLRQGLTTTASSGCSRQNRSGRTRGLSTRFGTRSKQRTFNGACIEGIRAEGVL